MGLDHIRAEIALRLLVGRQRKELLQLQKAGIAPASANALLLRMLDKIVRLCSERDRLRAELSKPKGRVLG